MKYGHAETHLRAANPATWQWRLRGEMMSDPTVTVIVSVGLSALIALALLAYGLWHLESNYQRREGTPPKPPATR